MKTTYSLLGRALPTSAIALVLACAAGSFAADQEGAPGAAMPWLDIAGEPLPFEDEAAVLEALRAATVVNRGPVSRPGLEGFEMLVLDHQGAEFHALFVGEGEAASFELAAYELDRLLGLGHVPPLVLRRCNGDPGVVQIWRGRAGTEREIAETGMLIPPDQKDYDRQRQSMYLLDNLIANPRRSTENVVIDPAWKLWLIDHSRAFGPTSELLYELEMIKCDRSVWQRLQELDKDILQERVGPYLDKKSVAKVVVRHRKLVRYIQQMITTFGEDVVLFDRL